MTDIRYGNYVDFPGWSGAPDFFKSLIAAHGCRRVLEVGSGANPTLSPGFVAEAGITYVTSDARAEELEKADSAFERLVLQVDSPTFDPALTSSFDCVLSRMVGEHIRNGERYHRNILRMLRPGGIAVHCFSTLWCLPFAVNRLVPDALGDLLLAKFAPRPAHKHGKFKAYYSWSRGPTPAMLHSFTSLGFEVLAYGGYFGHGYYLSRLPGLHRVEGAKARWLVRHPIPQLCSYATVVLRKPADS